MFQFIVNDFQVLFSRAYNLSFSIAWLLESNILGGLISLNHPDAGGVDVDFPGYGNPPVQFDSSIGAEPNVLVNLSPSNARPVDTKYFQDENVTIQELILTKALTTTVCRTLGEPGNPINPVFALYQGDYWIHDPRYVSQTVLVYTYQ
jgi:hypothetical protein